MLKSIVITIHNPLKIVHLRLHFEVILQIVSVKTIYSCILVCTKTKVHLYHIASSINVINATYYRTVNGAFLPTFIVCDIRDDIDKNCDTFRIMNLNTIDLNVCLFIDTVALMNIIKSPNQQSVFHIAIHIP